ncbi:MAG: YibE/F family protein [Patescibacteria group bacterium]
MIKKINKPTKKIFLFIIFILPFFLLNTKKIFAQEISEPIVHEEMLEGKVVNIKNFGKETVFDELVPFQDLQILISRGKKTGESITIKNIANIGASANLEFQEYEVGDKIKIYSSSSEGQETSYSITGKVKRDGIILLTILFVVAVLAVGRIWGALSLLGMGISFAVIFKLIIPLIINGINPVFAALLGSLIIIPSTFYVSHGFNKKTHVGVISTIIALMFTGLLAIYFVDATHLTGFASEEAGFIQIERSGSIDIRGLLLAGIIIGTLGILDDVTVGQASVVQQLKKARPKSSLGELFKNGMKVGQDHISSMVNTLVLVYSGSALPLLLLFFGNEQSFIDILEYELIAEEIVRMLVGSIGLVLIAPLATLMAAWVFSRDDKSKS